jgi:DNA gyrase/topoisomerase IV subunit B
MKNSEKYSKSTIKPLDFSEHVKKRPFMYFGNIISLFLGLVTDCIELSKTDKILFKIILLGDNDFAINISTNSSISLFLEHFTRKTNNFENYYLPQVLKTISKTFYIKKENDYEITISFSFDKIIIQNTTIDYLNLTEKALLISVLNKQIEILTIDKRHKYLSQNYYHFPEGIFYLFDKINKEVLGKPKFKITIDDIINSNQYQIGLAYRTDWYPTPHILSFANNTETKCGGSLVDGIFDGLLSACKAYVKKNNLDTFKVKRK